MQFHYRQQVLEQLEQHGVRPMSTTPPELLHDFVSDLYRFELRRLRKRYVRGEIKRLDYSGHVIALRKKYLLVSVPVGRWVLPQNAS